MTKAIKSFFLDLAKFKGLSSLGGFVYIIYVNPTALEANYVLSIKNNNFLEKVLISTFDSMIWHSKKELYYSDWKTVLKIRITLDKGWDWFNRFYFK